MVKQYTDVQLIDHVKNLPTFKRIPKDRWILGVRSNEDLPGKFDDKFYEFEGEVNKRVLTGTTNPGISILRHFENYNKQGAAILKSDEWYYDVWKYGLHKGKVPALLQLGSEFKVYRDEDKDNKSEEVGKIYTGYFGINFHTNTYDFSKHNLEVDTEDIGAWSAGCQVPNERDEFADMMKYYYNASRQSQQKNVTYCLIKEF